MAKGLGYSDAVRVLGGSMPAVAAFDQALGGVLLLGAAAGIGPVLSLFDAKVEFVRVGQALVTGLQERMLGLSRFDRTQRLHAAHTVLVVTAYFEAMEAAALPFGRADAAPTRDDQARLATAGRTGAWLTDLLAAEAPLPSPESPREAVADQLRGWYARLSERLLTHADGLAVRDLLDESARRRLAATLRDEVPALAVGRFEILHRALSLDVPEFGLWVRGQDDAATRGELRRVRQGLRDLETLLAAATSARPPDARRAALAAAYRAELDRPVAGSAGTPMLGDIYLDPRFLVRVSGAGDRPSDEEWWTEAEQRDDLPAFLAGYLTTPAATATPLVVLGQPGAGKSALTRVVAARLPPADFLPVRVSLRDVPAGAPVQDQIEYAVRAATGERIDWPDLSRSADGALPVVLLDGFDELLQATGVSQSDFLERVAQFQQREAAQGRPVAAVVTSRIAVADRARLPTGSPVLRLEPFADEQIERWLTIWNRFHDATFRASGLRPLPFDLVRRHGDLAGQPLLLLMLALYDARSNELQRLGDDGLDESSLYERLLTSYAEREVAKEHAGADERTVAGLVAEELMRLSVAAFAMFNRDLQWVTEAELSADLAALAIPPAAPARPADGFRSPLSAGGALIGRFFFIQRAQALRDDERLQTFEFLHATFGEFLIARLTVQIVRTLAVREAAASLPLRSATPEDGLLYALLSFAPLTGRAVLPFAAELLQQSGAAGPLADMLVERFRLAVAWTDLPASPYRPAFRPVADRQALFTLNLMLLALACGPVTTSRLFPGADDAVEEWRRWTGRWQAAVNRETWWAVVRDLAARHLWRGERRDLEVRLTVDAYPVPEPVDFYWTHEFAPGSLERSYMGFHLEDDALVRNNAHLRCEPLDDLYRHATEPIQEAMDEAVAYFAPLNDQDAKSVANTLVAVWLASDLTEGRPDLIARYETAVRATTRAWPPADWKPKGPRPALTLLLRMLGRDAARLPLADVIRFCRTVLNSEYLEDEHLPLLAACCAHPEAADLLSEIHNRGNSTG